MPRPCDVHVHLVPSLFEPDDLTGGVAVMIDVLRASTTICTALQNGAEAVVPLSEVPRTLALARSDERGVAGGERDGLPPEGFDLGNSPAMYTTESIGGKVVYFTTSNGTQALQRMRQAEAVYIAAFVNRAAVAARLQHETRPIHFICAGTDGAKTAEDVLLAGALVHDLLGEIGLDCSIGTQLAGDHFAVRGERLRDAIASGRGGRNLTRLGLDADIDAAIETSTIDLVPEWDLRTNRLSTAETPVPAAPETPPPSDDGGDRSDDGLGGW